VAATSKTASPGLQTPHHRPEHQRGSRLGWPPMSGTPVWGGRPKRLPRGDVPTTSPRPCTPCGKGHC